MRLFASGDFVNMKEAHFVCDEELKKIISGCDYGLINFEAPLVSSDCLAVLKAGPALNQINSACNSIKEMGFNLVSLANNHICDYGIEGVLLTIEELGRCGVKGIGVSKDFHHLFDPVVVSVNDKKVAFFAAAEAQFGCFKEELDEFGYAWLLSEELRKSIVYWNDHVDFIVLSAHAGLEHVDVPLPEWRSLYRGFVDLGVDVIVGHHPHVPQGIEYYGKSIICYSLGNFYFDWNLGPNSGNVNKSFSVIFNFDKEVTVERILVHCNKGNAVFLVDDPEFVHGLNAKLQGGVYEAIVRKSVMDKYSKEYLQYFQSAFYSAMSVRGIYSAVRFVLKVLFNRRELWDRRRNSLIWHLFEVDTHRFAIARALKLKYK